MTTEPDPGKKPARDYSRADQQRRRAVKYANQKVCYYLSLRYRTLNSLRED